MGEVQLSLIRLATDADSDEITELFKSIFKDDLLIKLTDRQVLKEIIETKYILRKQCFIAVEEQRVIGLIVFGKFDDAYFIWIIKSFLKNFKKVCEFLVKFKNVVSLFKLIAYAIFNHKYVKRCNIKWICVADDYLRKGIGTRLINEVESRVNKNDPIVYVRTLFSDKQNIKFYLRNGFHLVKYSFGRVLLERKY